MLTAAADRPHLKELFDIVDSVKGIGQVIATEILITTNNRCGENSCNLSSDNKLK